MKIVIGIPAFNEEKNIAKIIVKLQAITKDIIVCNDGSEDSTAEIAEKLGVTLVNHPKNLGYGASIRSIFLKAKEMDFDVLVTFDADGQHRIEDIKPVIEPIEKKEAEIVIGSRFLGKESDIPTFRKLGIKAITSLTNASTGKTITDSQDHPRQPRGAWLFPNDAGNRRRTESQQGHRFRAHRNTHTQGRARARAQQGTLFNHS